MSSEVLHSWMQDSQLISMVIGLVTLVAGLVGNTLNIIIFTSLKTFRETSSVFYLISVSFANIIHLLASLLSRVLISGYGIDLTKSSSMVCKLRQFVVVIAPLMVVSCMCFATIDQFLSLTIRWRHLSRRFIACRLVLVTLLFWCLINTPVIIYHNSYTSPTGVQTCAITNRDFNLYYTRFYVSFLLGFVQLTIRICFSILAFRRVRSLANRQTPIVRLGRDKQITSMVLIETVVDVMLSLPMFIYYTYTSYISLTDPSAIILYQLLITITSTIHYITFSIGFYIYCCASSRFRKQLIYVLVGIHLKYCCKNDNQNRQNQVVPQIINDAY